MIDPERSYAMISLKKVTKITPDKTPLFSYEIIEVIAYIQCFGK